MADVVVTVPKALWEDWIAEGDLPGAEDGEMESHFWIGGPMPCIETGERVYIVAHGKLRGYAPLRRVERSCSLRPDRRCLVRSGGAVAVTIEGPIRGFQGFRYRWWNREDEVPFSDWQAIYTLNHIMGCTGSGKGE
ncbi:hypothetical protein LCGC14_1332130 [marine sediment metagenome]|uniref:Uncharacterized protein n=1 Tax=marine sediment metagenome TaxID=412755 RepID=A0A0F9MX14_9ZZZZ